MQKKIVTGSTKRNVFNIFRLLERQLRTKGKETKPTKQLTS